MKNIVKEARAVDVNCMIGRGVTCAYKFESAAKLAVYMREFHIARAVVGSFMALNWNLKDGNRYLCEELRKFNKLSPCFLLSSNLGTSELPAPEELRTLLKESGAVAARVCPHSHGYNLDDFYAGALLELLDDARLPLLIEWDELDAVSFPEVCARHENIPFVILKAGFCKSRWMFPLLEKRRNVFFDFGRFDDSRLLEEIVGRFGAGRLLFGSGMPVLSPGPALALACYAEISDTDKRMLLSGSWERLEKGIRL